ncbi:MAG: glycosyltransferase N-terminal domain-containing protein [Pseudomonadota bacterium]
MTRITLLTALGALLAPVWLTLGRLRGAISDDEAKNRLGRATVARPNGRLIWLHAASLGELSAVRPLLSHIAQTRPDLRVLVTTNNPAALGVAAGWADLRLVLQTAPLDLGGSLRRFLDHWRPDGFINVETEIWPNRFAALRAADVPAIYVNARLSGRTADRIAKHGFQTLGLEHFRHFFAQSAATTAHLQSLGVKPGRVETTLNLKALVSLPDADAQLSALYRRDVTVLAASTHEGEDAPILDAFAALQRSNPDARLILVPRHPTRSDAVKEAVRAAGMTPVQLGDTVRTPGPLDVAVEDRLGFQPTLYGLAAVTFVGGSLIPGPGGHTPYEPIRAQSAVVTGPHTDNFAAEYAALLAQKACLVADRDGLAAALSQGLADPDVLARRAAGTLPKPAEARALFDRMLARLGM